LYCLFGVCRFILSANFHAGSEVASYPFDDSPSHRSGKISKAPDDAFFQVRVLIGEGIIVCVLNF